MIRMIKSINYQQEINMKYPIIRKRIGSMILTLAVALTMMVTALPVHAAGGGINIVYNPDVELEQPTNFELYKVGVFGRDASGKVTIELVEELKDCKVDLNIEAPPEGADEETIKKWVETWLEAAGRLGDWIKTPAEGKTIPDVVGKASLSKSASPQAVPKVGGGSYDNGIYLLMGDEQRVGEQYWSPVPVLIMVLDDDAQFEITNLKMTTRPVVHKHVVFKTWSDQELKEGRPESVTVGIFYAGQQIDTVKLNEKNKWRYTWYSQKALDRVYTSKDPEGNESSGAETEKLNKNNDYSLSMAQLPEDGLWSVDELSPSQYSVNENEYVYSIDYKASEDQDLETWDITNTALNPCRHDPPVLKTVTGDDPKTDEVFEFSLTGVEKPANVSDYPMPEGSKGNQKILKAKAGKAEEFGWITFRHPGTYVYEIKEVNTGAKNYKYDDSVYRLTYVVTKPAPSDSSKDLKMTLTTTKNGAVVNISTYEFVNEYKAPADGDSSSSSTGRTKTGDDTRIWIPVAVMAAALAALIVLLVKRRKKDDRNE